MARPSILRFLDLHLLLPQLDGPGGRQLRFDGLAELLQINLSVTIQIESSQYRHYLLLAGQVSHAPQESFQVLLIDVIIIPIVHSAERRPHAEIVAGLQRSLDILSFQM